MLARGNKIKFGIFVLTALILSVFFIPALAGITPTAASEFALASSINLPTTNCDAYLTDPAHHLLSNIPQEDGSQAFSYGADNIHFVANVAGVVTFNVNLLFDPQATTTIKLNFLNDACSPSAGYAFGDFADRANTFAYNTLNQTLSINGDAPFRIFYNSTPQYIWVEVLDRYPAATMMSYSYLVDLTNPQNPSGGEPTEPPGINHPVIIIPGILGSVEKNGEWLMDPVLHTYTDLVNTLLANGYIAGETIFGFPYNWKQSNVVTAEQLKTRIDYVKSVCNCDKVDLVAHSMGGLVARQYIQSNYYGDDVNQLIFLGTPHLGSPKDYLAWEGGVFDYGTDVVSKMKNLLILAESRHKGFRNLFDYIRNVPIYSVQELLPVYSYLKDNLITRTYPIDYPINNFLLDLESKVGRLYNSGVKITNIIGNAGDKSTINIIRVFTDSSNSPQWEDGYPENFNENIGDRGLEMGEGDGTVPVLSSTSLVPDSIQINSNHQSLPVKAEGIVYKQLTGLEPSRLIDNSYVTNPILILRMLSPADMQIVAPDGKKIGKDFSTGQELNEIPDAFYSGFETDNEFVAIPNPIDGQYQIVTQGTGSGEYTIASAMISDDQDLQQDFQAQTAPGQMQTLNLDLSAVDNTLIVTPQDTNPPQITVNSPQNQDYPRSTSLTINYDVADDDSGIFSQSSKFDSINTDNNQLIDLFYQPLGDHVFTVQVQDNVGNEANATVNLRVIATVDSTIADINRAYDLRWISKKSVRDELLKKLNKIVKIENSKKRIEVKEKKIDKILAKLLVKELKDYRKNRINEQAYNLLVEDINWLINH